MKAAWGARRRLGRRECVWGGVWGISVRGRPAGESRMSPSAEKGSRQSCAVLLPQGPRPGGTPPPSAGGGCGETPRPPRSLAPPPRLACSSPPPTSLQAQHLLRRPSPPQARHGVENYGGGSRPQAGGKAHGECLGVSPIAAGKGKGGENELLRAGELPGFPTWGRPLDGREARGNPGHFSGNPLAKGGSFCLHTLVTMTIQLQPPVAFAAAYPIRLVSFLFIPGLHPIPSNSLPACRGWGHRKEEGVLSFTLGREGRPETRDWRPEL